MYDSLLFAELKLLSIRACPSVTPEGLLSVLALPFLQHFDYYTAAPVPKWFVRGIAAQNPSLESISVHTSATPPGDYDESPPPDPSSLLDSMYMDAAWSAEEKKDFFKEHPRIKALHNLVSIPSDDYLIIMRTPLFCLELNSLSVNLF